MRKILLLLALTVCAVVVAPGMARAVTVAVFDDPAFVDSAGGSGAESDNVQASLTQFGHTVKRFDGTGSSAFSRGLAGARLHIGCGRQWCIGRFIGHREQHAHQRDSIGEAVVQARQQHATALVILDQVVLPRRLAEVDRRAHEVADQLLQRLLIVRRPRRVPSRGNPERSRGRMRRGGSSLAVARQ